MLKFLHIVHAKIWKKLELFYYRICIIHLYRNSKEKEIKEVVSYLKRNSADVLNTYFPQELDESNIAVFLDNVSGLFYVIRNNRKLYFPQSWEKEQVRKYYSTILKEQSDNSAHCYLTDNLKNRNYHTIVDVGGAEGIFAFDLLEYSQNIFIFEGDKQWWEPLRYTFMGNEGKVKIGRAHV